MELDQIKSHSCQSFCIFGLLLISFLLLCFSEIQHSEISCKMNHLTKWGQSLHHPQNFIPTFSHRKAFSFFRFTYPLWGINLPTVCGTNVSIWTGVCVSDGYQAHSSTHCRWTRASSIWKLWKRLCWQGAELKPVGLFSIQKELNHREKFCNRRVYKVL